MSNSIGTEEHLFQLYLLIAQHKGTMRSKKTQRRAPFWHHHP